MRLGLENGITIRVEKCSNIWFELLGTPGKAGGSYRRTKPSVPLNPRLNGSGINPPLSPQNKNFLLNPSARKIIFIKRPAHKKGASRRFCVKSIGGLLT